MFKSGTSNINYYGLGLAETHSHEQENKRSTRGQQHLIWFDQLHAHIHRQHQPKISTINDMDYNDINQHSQLTQITVLLVTNARQHIKKIVFGVGVKGGATKEMPTLRERR